MDPFVWLGIYLLVGVVALCACHNSSVCRRQTRLDRNQRIVSGLSSLFGLGEASGRQVPTSSKSSARS